MVQALEQPQLFPLHEGENTLPKGINIGNPTQISLLTKLLNLDNPNSWIEPNDVAALIAAAQEITPTGRLILFSGRQFESAAAADKFWLEAVKATLPQGRYLDRYLAKGSLRELIIRHCKASHRLPIDLISEDIIAMVGNMVTSISGILCHFQEVLIILCQQPGVITLESISNLLPSFPPELIHFLWDRVSAYRIYFNSSYDHRLAAASRVMEDYMHQLNFLDGLLIPKAATEYIYNHDIVQGAIGMTLSCWMRQEGVHPKLLEVLTSPNYLRVLEPNIQINPIIRASDSTPTSAQLNLRPDVLIIPTCHNTGQYLATVFDFKRHPQPDPLQAMLYSLAAWSISSRIRPGAEKLPSAIPKYDNEPDGLFLVGKQASGELSWPEEIGFFLVGLDSPEIERVGADQYDQEVLVAQIARIAQATTNNSDLVRRAITNQSTTLYAQPIPSVIGNHSWFEQDSLFKEG